MFAGMGALEKTTAVVFAISVVDKEESGLPASVISPFIGANCLSNVRIRVVFPTPLLPIIRQISPALSWAVIPVMSGS